MRPAAEDEYTKVNTCAAARLYKSITESIPRLLTFIVVCFEVILCLYLAILSSSICVFVPSGPFWLINHPFHPLSILLLCHVCLIYFHFTSLVLYSFLPAKTSHEENPNLQKKNQAHVYKPNKLPSNQ